MKSALQRGFPTRLQLILLLSFPISLATFAAASDPDSLPLPPPPVDVALLQPSDAGRAPEVLWADEATATEPIPAVPLLFLNRAALNRKPVDDMSPGIPKLTGEMPLSARVAYAAPVEKVLAAITLEAPKALTLESMLFEQLRTAMPQGAEGYLFEKLVLPNPAGLPAGGWKVRYEFHLPPRGIGPAPFSGNIIGENNQLLRAFTGSVTIDREAEGVQATRVIRRGEALSSGDVRLLGTRLSQLPRGALDRIDTIAGTAARQELRPGQWLTDQMVKAPEVIRSSQPVLMVVLRGPIRINAPGVARQAGAVGDVIRVENMQSQRMVNARVISKDEVQVVF